MGRGMCSIPFRSCRSRPNHTKLTTTRADLQYFVRANVALGAGYWYEAVQSRGLLAEWHDHQSAEPSLWAFYSGYYYRPYTGQTMWLRMSYLW